MGNQRRPRPGAARAALRRLWYDAEGVWQHVPARHQPRNLTIARVYLATDESAAAIGTRHGLSRERVRVIAREVVYATIGRRQPR